MKWDKRKIIEAVKILESNLGRRPVKKDNSNLYSLSRKYFGSWNNLLEESGFSVKRFQTPKMPKLNSNDLYYFLGLLCTDGHIQFMKKGGRYKLMLYTSEIEEREMIIKLINELFNYNASVRSRIYGFSKRPNYEIYISSKKVCEFFNNLGVPYGQKSYSLRVPKIIFKLSKVKQWNFIRGIFDGDGSIIFTKVNQTFKISSGSKYFIKDLEKLFIQNGFNSFRITDERDNLWELKLFKSNEIKGIHNLIYNKSKFFYPRKKIKWDNRYI